MQEEIGAFAAVLLLYEALTTSGNPCRRWLQRRKYVEKITGYIDHIIFRNEDNGYTVFQLNNENGELTCVGNFLISGKENFWSWKENM